MKTAIQSTLFIIFTALMLVSCGDKYYYDCESDESRRIVLSSNVTLAGQPRLQELQIESGQGLSLFITPNNTPAEVLYSNINIIADGEGGFAAQTMYYPLDGRSIDLFAIHPYSPTASLSTPVNFSIVGDQSDKSNYLNSDLLHATHSNQPRTTDPVVMTFSHKLSKLDFTIENNDGLNLGALNTVVVLNSLPSTTINMVNGNITAATGTTIPVTAYGVLGSPESRTSVTDIHAIVVPQTMAAGTQLFRITIGQETYTYTTSEALTFQSGYQYEIKLTITGGEISLESEVLPWEDGASIGGSVRPD